MMAELIMNAQNKDENAMMHLIFKFDPLLKKYAGKLKREDAYEDMRAYFIELIHFIDINNLRNPSEAGIVTYISRSVYTYYCHKVREIRYDRKEVAMTALSSEQIYLLESTFSTKESSNIFLELEAEKYLTEDEYLITHLIFEEGYSTEDVARMKKCSRQSVNQIKKRALKKIASLMDVKTR